MLHLSCEVNIFQVMQKSVTQGGRQFSWREREKQHIATRLLLINSKPQSPRYQDFFSSSSYGEPLNSYQYNCDLLPKSILEEEEQIAVWIVLLVDVQVVFVERFAC